MSTKADLKSEREVSEFALFVKALGSWSKITDVKSQPQDFADVASKFDGETVSFELLSIVDEDLASRKSGGMFWADTAKVDEKVSAKLREKNYKDSCSVELLIYSKATSLTTEVILHDSQKALWIDGLGPFRRVWFMSEDDRVFLFYKSWWSQIGLLPKIVES